MPPSNVRQADYPDGAQLLPNPRGSAPGLALHHDGTWIFALPGVPEEMEHLLDAEVLPRLREAAGIDEVLVSRVLRTWGQSESQVADELDDLFVASINPSVAFLASAGEIKIRITAKAPFRSDAEALIAPVESEIRRRLGPTLFGTDDDTIESVVLASLKKRGWRIGTAESVTGGGVAFRLTAIPGASDVVLGGVVAYDPSVKDSVLDALTDDGIVSEPTALAMAEGARRALGADVAVSTTGSAGPSELERPRGTVVIGVATPHGSRARELRLPGDRERVRVYAATAALHLVRLGIEGTWWQED